MSLLHASLSSRPSPRLRRRILGCALLLAAILPLAAQNPPMDATPPGAVETGAPAFVVLGTEALGLSTAPTDLHQMPDGRILVVSRTELLLGDGVRWELFRQSEGDRRVGTVSVAVDTDGSIYAGIPEGFARIEFGADGTWQHRLVASVPYDEHNERPVGINATIAGRAWYWHAGSGALVSWRPGQSACILGGLNACERVFAVGSAVFASEQVTGAVHRIEERSFRTAIPEGATTATATITCAAPFDADTALVGTNAGGLHLFDGTTMRPFACGAPLSGRRRINDLCTAGNGLYVAAVDAFGLVFFDRSGRILQVLPGSLDQRLSRVQRLHYAPGGVVWALLHEGIARIEFPSRLSYFNPLVPNGMAYAQPIRHEGRFWLLSDGRVLRGVYSPELRLERLEDDTPAGEYVHSISATAGPLLASNENGIFRYNGSAWHLAAPGPVNARINIRSRDGRRWLYVARGEIGWLTPTADSLEMQRIPVPELGDNFGVPEDGAGIVWVELGNCRVARIDQSEDIPRIQILGSAQGLGGGWSQIFILDGVAHFSGAAGFQRFDESIQRFVDDPDLLKRYPQMMAGDGRPARDTAGRLWITRREGMIMIDEHSSASPHLYNPLPADIRPYKCTMESGGIVWLHELRRLTRYDPAMPLVEPTPLRAAITRVQLGAGGRTLYPTERRLAPLPYTDNSLLAHFLAPGNPFGPPVSFEVQLEGAEGGWFPVGSTCSAAFNGLREGNYVLHVRPRAGSTIGEEASLAFTIQPPWYRTPLAYVAYLTSILAAGILGIRAPALLGRRQKARLERVVALRTRELESANQQLARQVEETLRKASELQESEERFRRVNEQLAQRVDEHTASLHGAGEHRANANRELESFSAALTQELRAPLHQISNSAELLHKRLAVQLDSESAHALGEIAAESTRLSQRLDSLLAYSRLARAELRRSSVGMSALFAQVRSEFAGELAGRCVEIRLAALPEVWADPALLRQVLAHLLSNALKFTRSRSPALIELGLLPGDASGGEQVFFIRDNGIGFSPPKAGTLFGMFQRLHTAPEFEGSGLGLASVRRIVTRHGGRVWADGVPNCGATIYFTLPLGAQRN